MHTTPNSPPFAAFPLFPAAISRSSQAARCSVAADPLPDTSCSASTQRPSKLSKAAHNGGQERVSRPVWYGLLPQLTRCSPAFPADSPATLFPAAKTQAGTNGAASGKAAFAEEIRDEIAQENEGVWLCSCVCSPRLRGLCAEIGALILNADFEESDIDKEIDKRWAELSDAKKQVRASRGLGVGGRLEAHDCAAGVRQPRRRGQAQQGEKIRDSNPVGFRAEFAHFLRGNNRERTPLSPRRPRPPRYARLSLQTPPNPPSIARRS